MSNNDELQVIKSDSLNAITRAEMDSAVDIAKRYPRDMEKAMKNILYLSTQDRETAGSCFYALKRGGTIIQGVSIRFAEIVASQWGNLKYGARIVSNDGRTVTAQGICHDLESNTMNTGEAFRRITDKNGKTYNEDMQALTAAAACSIAARNAIFKCIPLAITNKIQDKIKDVVLGNTADFGTTRKKAIEHFTTLKIEDKLITQAQVLALLERESVEDITRDDVFILRGIVTAIKEGTTTLEMTFYPEKNVKSNATAEMLKNNESENQSQDKQEEAKPVVPTHTYKATKDIVMGSRTIKKDEVAEAGNDTFTFKTGADLTDLIGFTEEELLPMIGDSLVKIEIPKKKK